MKQEVVDFTSPAFLRAHIDSVLRFYYPNSWDDNGGFFHYFKDNGTVYDRDHRHLVSATRYVVNWAQAATFGQEPPPNATLQQWAEHAYQHVQTFRLPNSLYAWTLRKGKVEDATIMAYGQAFVLLATSHAANIGLCDKQEILRVFDAMEDAFYEKKNEAYADEITPEGVCIDYRGQNANMHMCEACLFAYTVTHNKRYLQRALQLIETFVFGLAAKTNGLVWEHYNKDWEIDWEYNLHDATNIFKPWGFQVGHQTEWAKLLLIAHEHSPDIRFLEKAVWLMSKAFEYGWDKTNGGLIYGFAPDYAPCDTKKYFWVQAESFATAMRVYKLSKNKVFLQQYQKIWEWSWQHMVDHTYGGWFRILAANGDKLEDTKSPAGKVDYHTMGACWDVLAESHR